MVSPGIKGREERKEEGKKGGREERREGRKEGGKKGGRKERREGRKEGGKKGGREEKREEEKLIPSFSPHPSQLQSGLPLLLCL